MNPIEQPQIKRPSDPDHQYPCPGCKVLPGQLHKPGCGIETCPRCGHHLSACVHQQQLAGAKRLPWTGVSVYALACQQLGFYAKSVTEVGSKRTKWLACAPDDPDALPDSGRLCNAAVWDQQQQRWRLAPVKPG
jgi:hypothetical protein